MNERIAVSLIQLVMDVAERSGLDRAELIAASSLDQSVLSDSTRLVDLEHFVRTWRFVMESSGDPAFGLRAAELALDLRTQGFWGYALMSSTTLRERTQLHAKYQATRGLVQLSFWEEGEIAVLDIPRVSLPPELSAPFLDWGLASSIRQLQRHTQNPELPLALWVNYSERPHHVALRQIVNGPVFFDSPFVRVQFPASALDTHLAGDPHLRELAAAELDRQLAIQGSAFAPEDVLERVRRSLVRRLESDASMTRVAADLGLSVRTLQRKLAARGATFHELLEDARRAQALALLAHGEESIERIAVQLGYGDSSNFRRAFRRWTGLSPSSYRDRKRRRPSSADEAAEADCQRAPGLVPAEADIH